LSFNGDDFVELMTVPVGEDQWDYSAACSEIKNRRTLPGIDKMRQKDGIDRKAIAVPMLATEQIAAKQVVKAYLRGSFSVVAISHLCLFFIPVK
jgi:hypothetical protein